VEDTDVTLYEVDDGGDPVGRLVESESHEPGAADDSHEIEGLSPEEAAMHLTTAEEAAKHVAED
jgi:hypothetical protein